ncbi:hypothetical protein [Flagellimonas nanhaiensis]|uniref:Uncharacterized protein n=1 Tax=Flagellimonas nanhaiensis TaxID=2292706 RepID=A0A371JQ16_9FLAO|nr:hypothetical protein [Allomuricauda nanhaiensis]RDY59614.1 hypothetical protein DX873_09585 [Allomuricauda nanhaiensis]
MRTLFYLCISISTLFLFFACSGNSKKDISKSKFYWTPKEVAKSELYNNAFFSEIHENQLGRYVFAHETIPREWEDEQKFITVYDMSEMDKKGLFCRLFVNKNAGPDKIYETMAKHPASKNKAHLRFDYFLDSLQGDFHYNEKVSKEELSWESQRYPVFMPGVIPGATDEEEEMSLTQQKIIEILLKNQKYVDSKEDNTILLGLKYSLVDGSSPGPKAKKNKVELASGQILLTNVDKGMELISKIPKYGLPEPFMRNRDLEEEALKLMKNYARNQGWEEKFKKAIITSDFNIKRNRFSGAITGRTIIFALVGEWPDGTWTSQFFKTYQAHQGNNKFGPLRYDGTGKQRKVWGGAIEL